MGVSDIHTKLRELALAQGRKRSAARFRHAPAEQRHIGAYKSWRSMLMRCYSHSSPSYQWYGAKGIEVCARWHDFANFYADMGDRPDGMTLDRIDRAGNYEPSNCRWATAREQQNNRSTNVVISALGKEMTVRQWERETGLTRGTIGKRLAMGWDSVLAATTPTVAPGFSDKSKASEAGRKAAHPRGEDCNLSRITADTAKAIKAAPGRADDVGAKYGVSGALVRLIRKGKAWNHV